MQGNNPIPMENSIFAEGGDVGSQVGVRLQPGSDRNEDPTDVNSQPSKEIRRAVLIDSKLYTFVGQPHPEISVLLDLLEAKSDDSKYQMISFLRKKLKTFELYVKTKCSFLKNRIQITLQEFVIYIAFLTLYIISAIILDSLSSQVVVKKSEWKIQLAQNQIWFGLVFTFYGIVYINLTSVIFILALFLVCIVLPLLLLLYDFNILISDSNNEFEYSTFLSRIYPMAMFIHWFIFSLSYNWVKKQMSLWSSVLFSIAWCVVLPFYMGTQVIEYLLLESDFSTGLMISQLLNVLLAPLIILFTISWVLMHFRLFMLPLSHIQTALARIKDEIKRRFKKPEPVEETNKCNNLLHSNMHRIASAIVGTFYIGCETCAILLLKQEFVETETSTENFIILMTLIGIIPVFVIIGIVISVSQRKSWITFTFFPLCVATLPLIGIVPLSNIVAETSLGVTGQVVTVLALPVVVLFWLCLTVYGIQRRQKYLIFITYTCVFFVFPLGFLLPISYMTRQGEDFSNYSTVAAFIIATGVGLLLLDFIIRMIVTIYRMARRPKQLKKEDESFDISELAYYNLKEAGFLVNSICFTIGYLMIVYVFFESPTEASDDDRGFVDGMMVILPIIFLLFTHAIQIESSEIVIVEIEEEDDAGTLSKSTVMQSAAEDEFAIDPAIKHSRVKSQNRFVRFGIIVPFLVFFPLWIISDNRQLTTMFLMLFVGVPVAFIFYKVLLDTKNKSEKFQNFFTPFIASIMWFLVILPLFVIAPIISSYIDSTSEDFATFMKIITVVVALLLVIGVTCFSIFVFIIKNQLEKEKRKKFVITQMMKVCVDCKVKAVVDPLAILYDRFVKIKENEDKMKNQLQMQRKPIRYDPKKPKLENFDQRIVISHQQAQKKAKEKVRDNWDVCLDYLLCRIGMQTDDLNEFSELDNRSEIRMEDLSDDIEQVESCMDDYLPQQIKKGYLYSKQEKNGGEEDEKIGLMHEIEITPEQRAYEMYQADRSKPQSKFDILSSKTLKFRGFNVAPIRKAIADYSSTDHVFLMYNSEQERAIFLEDIYRDFANEDHNLPLSLIFNDFIELCRVSAIIEPEKPELKQMQQTQSKKIEQPGMKPASRGAFIENIKRRDDDTESESESDDDNTISKFLTRPQLSQIYDAHAQQLWKGSTFSMNLKDFASAITAIATKLQSRKDSSTPSHKIRELLVDRMYGCLLTNVPFLANNYRPDARKFIMPDEEKLQERLKQSPFYFERIEETKRNNQDSALVFSYNRRQMNEAARSGPSNPGTTTNAQLAQGQLVSPSNHQTFGNNSRGPIQRASSTEQSRDSRIHPSGRSSLSKRKQVSCFVSMCRCLRKFFCVVPYNFYMDTVKKINLLIQRLTNTKVEGSKGRIPVLIKAPAWDDMASNLVTTMAQAIHTYEENKRQAENIVFPWNLNNILVVFGKLSDFATLYGVAFNNSVEWFPDVSTKVDTQEVTSGSIIPSFAYVFWMCVLLSFVYFVLAIVAVGHAERGTLGKDETGDNASWKHRQFWISKGVNTLGSSLFLFIMKAIIDSYVCNWAGASPWELIRDESIQCMQDTHLLMMGLGFLALLAYYPLSTFIQPSIQFLDATLDVKYDKSYVVVYIQAKLLILGSTSFFNSFENEQMVSIVQLATTSGVGFILAMFAIKIQPCLVQIVNPIEIGAFLLIGIINGIGLIIILIEQSLIGFIVNLILHVIVIIGVGIAVNRKLKMRVKEKKEFQQGDLPVIMTTANRRKDQNNLLGLLAVKRDPNTILNDVDVDPKKTAAQTAYIEDIDDK